MMELRDYAICAIVAIIFYQYQDFLFMGQTTEKDDSIKLLDSFTCSKYGKPLSPENVTLYLNRNLADDDIATLVYQLPKRCRTVIIDCPRYISPEDLLTSSSATDCHALSYPLLEYIAEFNKDTAHEDKRPVLKVWLRYTGTDAFDVNCHKFAIHGNIISPGTVQGILLNSDPRMQALVNHPGPVIWANKLNSFQENSLKLGLIMDDYDCYANSRLPSFVLEGLDVIYYFSGREGHGNKFSSQGPTGNLNLRKSYGCKKLFQVNAPAGVDVMVKHALLDFQIIKTTDNNYCIFYK